MDQQTLGMFIKSLRVFTIVLVAVGCNEHDPADTKYLDEVIDIMETNSINRKTIDWGKFRADVIASANGGNSDSDINRALATALTNLHDHHSFIIRGATSIFTRDPLVCTGSSTGVANVPANIGYIKVPGYSGNDNALSIGLQDKIKQQDSESIIGWIVDLRGNTGGNMWPMLAGVGPILGYEVAGYFIDPNENASDWHYNNMGSSAYGVNPVTTVPNPYSLIHYLPKVAVLTDQQTASSGEAIAVAFINRPNTRSFGTSTCGLSTANAGYNLSDGATLQLTVSVMADRNKNKKGGPLVPDVTVAGDQEVVNKAVEWLTQP
jgi:carboxyl-terminal processing protease